MKHLKTLLWFIGLMTVCGVASAEPVTAAWAAFSSWASAASIPTILSAVGTGISVVGALSAGNSAAANGQSQNAQAEYAAQQSEYQADQLDQAAGQRRATAQRQGMEQRRRAAIAESNLQARAGGGSTDPSILGLTGNIAGEGEYNALAAMFEGEESARGSEMQATSARGQAGQYRASGQAALARADVAQSASRINAVGTIFNGASSLYSKFGNGGPSASTGDGMGQGDRRKIGVY
jgi:hypothetical protein